MTIDEFTELLTKLRCAGCGRRPEEIDGYLIRAIEEFAPEPPKYMEKHRLSAFMAAHWTAATPETRVQAVRAYVAVEEGTLNRTTGAFACDTCYIIAGAPSSPDGWTVPDEATWPNQRKLFKQFAALKKMTIPTCKEDESDKPRDQQQ